MVLVVVVLTMTTTMTVYIDCQEQAGSRITNQHSIDNYRSTGGCMFVAQKYALIFLISIKTTIFCRLIKSTSNTLDNLVFVKLN